MKIRPIILVALCILLLAPMARASSDPILRCLDEALRLRYDFMTNPSKAYGAVSSMSNFGQHAQGASTNFDSKAWAYFFTSARIVPLRLVDTEVSLAYYNPIVDVAAIAKLACESQRQEFLSITAVTGQTVRGQPLDSTNGLPQWLLEAEKDGSISFSAREETLSALIRDSDAILSRADSARGVFGPKKVEMTDAQLANFQVSSAFSRVSLWQRARPTMWPTIRNCLAENVVHEYTACMGRLFPNGTQGIERTEGDSFLRWKRSAVPVFAYMAGEVEFVVFTAPDANTVFGVALFDQGVPKTLVVKQFDDLFPSWYRKYAN